MSFRKYVLCLLFAVPVIAMDDSSIIMNNHGEQVLPISPEDEVRFEALNNRFKSFKPLYLNKYLANIGLIHLRPYFEVGRIYHEYRMLEYELQQALELIQSEQLLDTNVQNQAYYQQRIAQITKLLDYVFLITYQTKLSDVAAWNALSHEKQKAMIDAIPMAQAAVLEKEKKYVSPKVLTTSVSPKALASVNLKALAYKNKLEELRVSEGANHDLSNRILLELLLHKMSPLDFRIPENQELLDQIVQRDKQALKEALKNNDNEIDNLERSLSQRAARFYVSILDDYVNDENVNLIDHFDQDWVERHLLDI